MGDNSLVLLLCTLIPLSIIVFIISNFDIIHPVVILSWMLTFSVSLATLMSQYWHYTVSVDTAILIISGILVFSVFGLWASYKIEAVNKFNLKPQLIAMPDYLFIFCIFLLGIMCIFSFNEIYMLSKELGGASNNLMLRTVRLALERGEISLSRWHIYRQIAATCIAYISAFIIINNYFVSGSLNKRYFLLIALFFPFLILSTGRLEMLKFVVYSFFLVIIIYQQRCNFSIQSKKRTLLYVASTSLLFFVCFLLMGFFTGKVTVGGRSPLVILAHYGGIQIPALSLWLDTIRNENMLIGYMTLPGIYHMLNSFGLKLPILPGFLPFVKFYGIDTNVYTFFRRLIEDYGYIGMYLLIAILGIFYSTFYCYIRNRVPGFPLIVYGVMAISLIWAINEESFFLIFFNAKTIYQISLLYLFYHLLHKSDYDYNEDLATNGKK